MRNVPVVRGIAIAVVWTSTAIAQSADDGWGGVCWSARTGGAIRSVPAVTNDAVYVGSADGYFYKLDRRSGSIRWRFAAGSPVDGAPDVGAQLVYVTARNGRVYAVEKESGRLRWSHQAGAAVMLGPYQRGYDLFVAGPRTADSSVIVGGPDGVVWAFDAVSGRARWHVALGTSIWATPAVDGGTLYIAANDGRLYALERRTGARRWRFDTEGAGLDLAKEGFDRRSIQSSPVIGEGMVLFGSRDGHLYAVDAKSGQQRWRAAYAPSWIVSSPTVDGDTVYVTTSDAQLVAALDARSGREIWRRRLGGRLFPAAAISGTALYVGTNEGQFVALDRATGAVRWRYLVGDPLHATPVARDGIVYLGSDGGRIEAISLSAGSFPVRAVFWDPMYERLGPVRGGSALREYLAENGFELLDSAALGSFLRARIDDRRPSAIVFAQDVLPNADTAAFHEYLAAQGKVVWFGNPPLALGRDSTGGIPRDSSGYPDDISLARTDRLLGNIYKLGRFDGTNWWATPTPTGRAWGLDDGRIISGSVGIAGVSEVLAVTETGFAGAWVKSYGGPRGSGFVMLGGGGVPRADGIPLEQLASIRRVADYGLIRRAGGCH